MIKSNLVLPRSAATCTPRHGPTGVPALRWEGVLSPGRARVTKGTHCHVNNLVLMKLLGRKGNITRPAEQMGLLLPPEVMGWRNNYTDTRLFLENTDANVLSLNVCTTW